MASLHLRFMKIIRKHLVPILLFLVIVLAGVLRIWNLGNNPPALTPDEASLGYNAYSILKTGKDEYGKALPIIFKSFGDYKPGLYVYLAVPFVAVFGLSEFAVRLPSALFSILAVFLIYQVTRLLFPDRPRLGLISAFVLAVTPWSIYFARGAWEVNVALTLTLGGVYFFLKAQKNAWHIISSVFCFSLTFLTYQGAKLSTGLVIVILTALYWKNVVGFLKASKKQVVLSLFLGLVITTPIIFSLFSGQTGRLTVFSIFSYTRPVEYVQNILDQGGEKLGSKNYYLFHSEALNFKMGILTRWFNHFSGKFLFTEGDWMNPTHSAPYQGVLLLTDILLLVFGIAALARRGSTKESWFIWLWLILSPLPAALSRDQIHAVRALNMVAPAVIILSLGFDKLLDLLRPLKYKFALYVLFVMFYVLGFLYFAYAYYIHVPSHNSQYLEYGYKQVVETVSKIQKNYATVKVQQSFAQPYIYFLFYEKYDPAKYQKTAELADSGLKGDVGYVLRLDNIEFAPIDWSINRKEHGVLFVADTIRIPPQDSIDPNLFKVVEEIKYLNNRDTAFRIVEVK